MCAAGAVAVAFVRAGCSKSPADSAIDAANSLATRLIAPLLQKDASMKARKLIDKLADRPECEVYKQRLRQVGKASPYAATTHLALQNAYQDADRAARGKPD